MSVSGVSTSRAGHRTAGSAGEAFEQARWLAWKDIKRAWLSYPASGLFMLFFGFLSLSVLWGLETQETNGVRNLPQAWFFADFLFVITGCVLVVNAISGDYVRIWAEDVFSSRTGFLKSLPISTGTLVASRVISMLFAIPFTVPAFFLPAYFFTSLGELGSSYVWFVGIWLGWGLLYAGVTLLCELGLRGRTYCWSSFVLVVVLAIGLLAFEGAFDFSLLRGAESLASSYGPLPALVSLAVGAVGFWLFARLTVRRINTREVVS